MLLALMLLGVLLTPQQAAQQPEPGAAEATGAPQWLERPSGEDLGRFFPPRAMMDGVSGRVVLSCVVDGEGALADCAVASEEPEGYDFGEATLRLVPLFRMTPGNAGARVGIPVTWNAPEPGAGPAIMIHLGDLAWCTALAAAQYEADPTAGRREHLRQMTALHGFISEMQENEEERSRLQERTAAYSAEVEQRLAAGEPLEPCELIAGPRSLRLRSPVLTEF